VFYHTKLAHITYVTFPRLCQHSLFSDSNSKWILSQNALY